MRDESVGERDFGTASGAASGRRIWFEFYHPQFVVRVDRAESDLNAGVFRVCKVSAVLVQQRFRSARVGSKYGVAEG